MKNRDVGDGWAGLADQLTLSQPEGADCAPTLLLTHPALGSFLRPCLRSIFVSYHENLKDKNINLKKTNMYVHESKNLASEIILTHCIGI